MVAAPGAHIIFAQIEKRRARPISPSSFKVLSSLSAVRHSTTAEDVYKRQVYLHAGVLIIVKGTAGHAISTDLYPIKLCRFSGADRLLDCFKYILCHVPLTVGLSHRGDVYKRQLFLCIHDFQLYALCRGTVIGNITGLQIQRLDLTGIGSTQPVGDLTVAPAGLDVYKRQRYFCLSFLL